jgi:hypothetical protein
MKYEVVGGISPLGAYLLRNKGNQYVRTHPTGISVLEGEPSQGGSFHFLNSRAGAVGRSWNLIIFK